MRFSSALAICVLTACGPGRRQDPGPPPDDDHQATVRAVLDRVIGDRYPLDGSPAYRFAAPVQDRVASWLWEPQEDGTAHSLGHRHGWCVEFWVQPSYAGYPDQPESHRMAFFGEGRLRGIFADGRGTAPLGLDRWTPVWLDDAWVAATAARRAALR